CATSKRWGASIWLTTRPRSRNWRQSLARKFTRQRQRYRKERNRDENVCAKSSGNDCACGDAFWRALVRETRHGGGAEQRRLLHLHDASVGACEGSREMSDLLDGSRAGNEERRRSEAVAGTAERAQNQILQVDHDAGRNECQTGQGQHGHGHGAGVRRGNNWSG